MRPAILVIGSLNADLVIQAPRFPASGETVVGDNVRVFPGGKGANQAVAAAKLGGHVSMIGRVGTDAYGRMLVANLAAARVSVTGVRRDSRVPTGVASILINADGENQIVIVPGANGALRVEHLRPVRSLLADGRIVLLQLEIPMPVTEAAAEIASNAGALVILDPAPARPLTSRLLACVDYLTPNETELAVLTGHRPGRCTRDELKRRALTLCRRGARRVIVKMGARGALLVSPGGTTFWPAFRVKPVDTTAAGDAFNGGFAFALAAGKSEFEAGRFGAAAAACSVTRHGAQPSLPTRAEVNRLLREAHPA